MNTQELLQAQKRPLKGLLRQISLMGGLNAMLLVAQMWLLARLISAIAFAEHPLPAHTDDIYPIVLIVIIRFFLNIYTDRRSLDLGYAVTQNVQKDLLHKLERLGPCASATIERGHLSTVMVEGAEKFGKYFSAYLPALSHVALIPVCTLVLVLPTDLLSAAIFMLTAPLIPLFMVLIGRGAQRVNQNHWKTLSRLGARLQESLRGLYTLKLFGATEAETRKIRDVSEEYKSTVMQVLRIAFLSAVTLEFFSTISIALVAVFIGFRLLAGEMAFQDGFLILLLAPEFYQPLRNLGTSYHIKMEAMASAEEITDILNMAEPTFDAAGETRNTDAKLSFRNVAFAYADHEHVLKDVSFDLAVGECVVIAGPSGVGKSTLLHLAMGFLCPTSGGIYLNGQTLTQAGNGQPLTQTGRQHWHREIAWMAQDPHLFDASLSHNITLNSEEQDEDRVRARLHDVHLTETVDRFPDGLMQRVGEQGRLMSGGEGRRLALARVLHKGAPLLIMDEPSANLDMDTERLILETLQKLKQNRTTMLIAAHRQQTLALADRVLTLQDGRIVEQASGGQSA